MGFEEISHTADWSARVWAPDLPSLFVEAARAMNSLSGTVARSGPRLKRVFATEAPDPESLLVAFLSELLYYQEQESLVFDEFKVEVKSPAARDGAILAPHGAQHTAGEGAQEKLEVQMEGAPLAAYEKAIKAVTYHNLKIQKTNKGVETTIVFDV